MNRFDLMNQGYHPIGGKPVIFLRSRDKNRVRQSHRIDGKVPHFWANGTGAGKNLFGDSIQRVDTVMPSEVRRLRDKFKYHCEADILFEWRYLLDKGVKCGYGLENGEIFAAPSLDIPPKKGYFDIEVETPPEIMAKPRDPIWPIVSFQFSNNYTKDLTLFMLKTDLPITEELPIPKGFIGCKNAITLPITFHRKLGGREWDVKVKPTIYLYDEERPMIHDATLWSVWQDFDAAGGYYSDGFDWPYWIRRGEKLQLHSVLKRLSPFGLTESKFKPQRGVRKDIARKVGTPQVKKWRLVSRVKGISMIDFYKMYRKWAGGRQGAKRVIPGKDFTSTFDFHLVMEKECGFYYVDLGDKVRESRSKHPLKWAEYCAGDAYALYILDKEKQLVAYFDRLRRIVGLPLEFAIHNSRLIDTRLLRLRGDAPLPTREYGKKHRVKGAIVLLPDIGIHEHIVIIDEKALYPMLIRVYNLSPETFVADSKDWRWDDIIVGPMEDGTVMHFRRKPEGILPKAVRYDMEEREKYRAILRTMSPTHPNYEMNKMLETLHKFLACSYYGVTGYENFRLYSDAVRRAITFLGRKALLECKIDCEKGGYKVRYGDTDSLFTQLRTDMPEEGRVIETIVNKTLKRIAWRAGATFNIEAKYEQYCRRIIFVPKIEKKRGRITAAKKRYAYTDKNNNLYVVGLAPRRSSTPSYTRRLMLRWLELVLVKKQVEGAKALIKHAWMTLPEQLMNTIGLPRGLHEEKYIARNPWKDGCDYMTERFGKVFREDKKPLLFWMLGRRTTATKKKIKGAKTKDLMREERKRKYAEGRKFKTNALAETERGCDTDVICLTETDERMPDELYPFVDWEKMRGLVLTNHFKPLFNAIGVDWEEVTEGKKTKKFKGKVVLHHEVKSRPLEMKETKELKLSKWT